MSGAEIFFDTSVLLYLLSADVAKADRAEAVLAQSGVISVQVLNEFTAVATGKPGLSPAENREVLDTVRAVCRTQALTVEDHDHAVQVAEYYRFSLYDSVIVASTLRAGCRILCSEDLQHGQLIEDQLTVIDPFR